MLAAAAFGEKSGTTTNLEGRVTTVGQKVSVAGTARPDWMIAVELAELLDHVDVADTLTSLDAITDAIAATVPAYAAATRAALRATPTACSPCPLPTAAFEPEIATRRDRVSYDYRLVLTPQAVRPGGRRRRTSPSLAAARQPARGARQPARPRRARGRRRQRGRIVGEGARSCSRSPPTSAVPRGSLPVPFNVAGRRRSATSSTPRAPAIDVRVERV